ncbi:hypothetical protein L873DRAFT_1467907 [Choiromyces venosus 120613-1]|uniref:Uncharacterized protein n=1 Tax=Choiromyces venosus 120613-1 TaxID=1336337 RepID=A0A3N4J7R6_9PEZI|nr:hypothetical protein L873DRAFT_1467907 [Choiromyces venosus 120613-1]
MRPQLIRRAAKRYPLLAKERVKNTVLGYSAPNSNSTDEAAERGRDGTRMVDYGEFVLKDRDTEVSAILKQSSGKDTSGTGFTGELGAFSLSQNLAGGKVLTKADLEKPVEAMLDPLLLRNVAREAVSLT